MIRVYRVGMWWGEVEAEDPGVQSGNVVGEVEDPGVQSGERCGVG